MLNQIAYYEYPDKKQHDLWYKCDERNCAVYLHYSEGWDGDPEIQFALDAVIENDARGIEVTRRCSISSIKDDCPRSRHIFTVCEFKPCLPYFNSDFFALDDRNLEDVKQLTQNVKVIVFRHQLFVHKYMTQGVSKRALKRRSRITQN